MGAEEMIALTREHTMFSTLAAISKGQPITPDLLEPPLGIPNAPPRLPA